MIRMIRNGTCYCRCYHCFNAFDTGRLCPALWLGKTGCRTLLHCVPSHLLARPGWILQAILGPVWLGFTTLYSLQTLLSQILYCMFSLYLIPILVSVKSVKTMITTTITCSLSSSSPTLGRAQTTGREFLHKERKRAAELYWRQLYWRAPACQTCSAVAAQVNGYRCGVQ